MTKKIENIELELFVPGRLCVFGEHSDWAGMYKTINADVVPGYALVTGIDQGITAVAKYHKDFYIHSELPQYKGKQLSCPMNNSILKQVALSKDFFSYVCGVASYVLEHYSIGGGLELNITNMSLPIKKGLSSSAAVCVLVARAFNLLYGLKLNTIGEMKLAYNGEQRTLSRCGRLDQACAFGKKPVFMTFNGNDIEVLPLQIKEEWNWVFADLMAKKDTVKILSQLNKCYPFPQNEKELQVYNYLGKENKKIVYQACAFMRDGKKVEFGKLMNHAQKAFDQKVAPACPEELTAPKLHEVLNDQEIHKWIYGAKGVGSQGDGAVQFLARDATSQKALRDYLRQKWKLKVYDFTLYPDKRIKKAIIPLAGYGTRLYPVTRGINKEFLPLVGRDNIAKPAILILLEELLEAGIEEICLVVSENQKEFYNNYFNNKINDEYYNKLSAEMQEYENKILEIGKRLIFIVQQERKGLGHAILKCRTFANQMPVLVLLGDMVYQTVEDVSCTRQILECYNRLGGVIVALQEEKTQNITKYGIATGVWENDYLVISKMVEKPSVEYAQEHLSVITPEQQQKYYSFFGQYIINSSVFEELQNLNETEEQDGELQLTDALSGVSKKERVHGVILNGRHFDIGIPEFYRDTICSYGKLEIVGRGGCIELRLH